MGDRTWVSMTFDASKIADKRRRMDLLNAIEDAAPEEDVGELLIAGKGIVQCLFDEVNYAELPDIEGMLEDWAVPYEKTWGGGDGYPGGALIFDGSAAWEFREGYAIPAYEMSEEPFASKTGQQIASFIEELRIKVSKPFPTTAAN